MDSFQDAIAYAAYVGAMSAINALGSMNLDNKTQQTEWMMPSGEDNDMQRRQKLTINGNTQWHTYNSTQELVNLVQAMTAAKFQPTKANRTFRDYALDWYERYKKPQLGAGHNENYKSMMKVHILPMIGDKDIADITVADVQDIMNTLKSASTGKQVKSIINMVMDAAIADELYHHPNPTKDKRIHMPTAKKAREPVSQEYLARIINHLPNMLPEHTSLLAMLIMTGARRGEALGARWEDIDWESKTIHLQRVVRFQTNQPVVSNIMKTPAANRTISLWDSLIPLPRGAAEDRLYRSQRRRTDIRTYSAQSMGCHDEGNEEDWRHALHSAPAPSQLCYDRSQQRTNSSEGSSRHAGPCELRHNDEYLCRAGQ